VTTTATQDRYRERLTPSILGWLLAPAVGVSIWFMLGILGQVVALIAGGAALGLTALALLGTSALLRVTGDTETPQWQAGRATIPVSLLGTPQVLDAEEMRRAMGPELAGAAYVCHRAWVHTGVRVPVQDPADPTPYWLVATRNPDQLARALLAAGAQAAHSEHTG